MTDADSGHDGGNEDDGGDVPTGARETTDIEGELAEYTSFLESIALFEDLAPEELREVYQAIEFREVPRGDVLFEQGDDAHSMFAVRDGRLQVRSSGPSGEEVLLAELESGTIVGEMSIIGGGTRSATVEAAEPTMMLELSREKFDKLRKEGRPVAYKIMMRLARLLEQRRRETETRIDDVFEDPATHIEQFEDQVHDLIAQLRKV